MSKEKKIDNIIRFLELKSQLEEIDSEIDYLNTLLYEARKNLNVKQLEVLEEYINTLTDKLDLLQKEKTEIINELETISPRYYRIISLTSKIVGYFISNRERVLNCEMSIDEFREKMKDISPKIDEIITILTQEKTQLSQLVSDYRNHTLAKILKKEIDKLGENLKMIAKIRKILHPDIDEIKKAVNYLGIWLKNYDTDDITLITDIMINRDDFSLLLEISKEKEIDSQIIEELFNDISIEIGANNIEEMLTLIQRDIGINLPTAPSLITKFLIKNKLTIKPSLMRKLIPKYNPVGFIPFSIIAKKAKEGDSQVISLKSSNIVRSMNAFKAPSLIKISRELIFKSLNIFGYRYSLFRSIILPRLGYSMILILRDEKSEPLPNYVFLKRFLEIIKRIRIKLLQDLNIAFDTNRMNPEDISWISRLLIIKALSDERNLTESNALRPNHVFSFCLKYGIPLFYEEILQSYFSVVETSNIIPKDGRLQLRVERIPYPVTKYMNMRYLAPYLPHDCIDLLGVTIKRDSVKIHCFTYLDDEVIQSLIRNYKVPSKLAITIENDPKKLLRSLILSQRITSLEEYSKVKKQLNVITIDYEEVERKIGRDSRDILQRVLLENY